jgi:AcrR family transcriptional regulator
LQRAKGPSLTPQRIVDVALQELDDRELAAFSIRSVAQRLGVYPTAIYWHVENREALLAEIVARILASVEPPLALPWQRYLRELFASYRAAGLPGRPWSKYLIYGMRPSFHPQLLPGLTEAIVRGDWPAAREQLALVAAAVGRNTALLRAAVDQALRM